MPKRRYQKAEEDSIGALLVLLILAAISGYSALSRWWDQLSDLNRVILGSICAVTILAAIGAIVTLFLYMRGRRNIERRRREALQDKEFAYQLAMAEEARKKKEQQAFANLRLRQFIDVSPEEFEISMGSLFRKQGFEVIHSGRQGDGGVDLEMEKDGLRYIVQCKRFTKQAVGEPSLRDFYGTLVHRKADHGFFVTTSKFTPQAEEFVKHKPLTLIDKDELQKWLT